MATDPGLFGRAVVELGSKSRSLATPYPHFCVVQCSQGACPTSPPNPTIFYFGQSELLSDSKKHHRLPFALRRRTVEAWIGKAEPEKYQPFAKFCPFVLRVLSASLRCSSKTLWPFRHAPIPYIFMIPFVATLCPSLTLGFCAIYLFSGIV